MGTLIYSVLCSIISNVSFRTPKFSALLINCARFLYEISDYDLCLRLTKTAAGGCDDKGSVEYADLCGIAGSAYYELNKLDLCRKEWELYKKIQEDVYKDNDLEVSNLAPTKKISPMDTKSSIALGILPQHGQS